MEEGRGGEGVLRVRRRGLITFFSLKTVKKGDLLEGGGGRVLKEDFRVIQESDIPYSFYEGRRLVTVLIALKRRECSKETR